MTPENVLSKMPDCIDSRECFVRRGGKCRILETTYPVDGQCPFCKRDRNDKTQNTIEKE